ncbi:MAG: DeoR/GlpR family DNA-binding transcription regulator [Oceanipulchritudo sp.]
MPFWKKSHPGSSEEEKRWERWRAILNVLEDRHVASVEELVDTTGSRESVIEEDLATLCAEGLVKRTARNGVTLEGYHPEKTLEERAVENIEAKRQIGRLVAEKYIQPGMVLFLDASTTVKAVAPFIAGQQVTLITNCLSLIAELRSLDFAGRIICTGGKYRAKSNSLVGESACREVTEHTADLALLGTDGISPKMEIMEADPEEARLKRAMLQHAGKTIVMALPNKFGDASLLPVGHLSKVEALISSSFPDPEFVKSARETGVRLECPA